LAEGRSETAEFEISEVKEVLVLVLYMTLIMVREPLVLIYSIRNRCIAYAYQKKTKE